MAPTQQQCFVEDVIEPIRICSVPRLPTKDGDDDDDENENEGATKIKHQQHAITTFDDLSRNLQDIQDQSRNHVHHFISICQRNSWRPLQITASMFELIMEKLSLNNSLRDIVSCFYTRNMNVEEVFCMPYTERRKGSVVEASYTIRYPEYKPDEDTWVIRQTGVYHRCDAASRQSLFIMVNPTPNSQASSRAIERLSTSRSFGVGSETETDDPVWLHQLVFETYLPAWRFYIASMERQFLPLPPHKTSQPREPVPDNLINLGIIRGDADGAICPMHPPFAAAKGVGEERRQRRLQSLLADGDGPAPPRANDVAAAGQHALLSRAARLQEAE
ncbi:hypothetical protein CFIO01_13436 [Colletotrichum fioriniae PJ7]|uniref:CorA-like transporter domain-containing protein n=1 Tax=Colletotrichum fioriniae PJ7 TaxID=1445577 RepID=A0A010R2Y0_9PEZI|nr:hypothetical protein CFIO01_13436 [Colletotrichum fioriniae PJ7]